MHRRNIARWQEGGRHLNGTGALSSPIEFLILAGCCAALFLPGSISIPPIDRDEARFAEASRAMASSDRVADWLIPMLDGRPRLSKPPVIYWLQATSVTWLAPESIQTPVPPPTRHRSIWAYRVPSILASTLSVLMTWRLGRSLFPGPCGLLAGLFLAGSMVVTADAHQARADQVLLLWTTLAQMALWSIWSGRMPLGARIWPVLLFWIAVGLGIMTKGPVTPAIVGMTMIALSWLTRDWRWLSKTRPAVGLVVMTCLVAPWFLAAGSTVGWETFAQVIKDEVLTRAAISREGHWGPPGYYVLVLLVGFWPGSLALAPAMIHGFQRGILRNDDSKHASGWMRSLGQWRGGRDAELFLLCWWIPAWVVFELLATKLPHYTLPMYPAIALLCSRGIFARSTWLRVRSHKLGRFALVGWLMVGEALLIALPGLLLAWGWRELPPGIRGVASGIIALNQVWVVIAARCIRAEKMVQATVAASIGSVGLSVCCFGLLIPNLRPLWLSVASMEAIEAVDPDLERPVAAIGYHEDSLEFLTTGRIDRIKLHQLQNWAVEHPDGLVLAVVSPIYREAGLRTISSVRGFNYTKGRWVELELMAIESLLRLKETAEFREAGFGR